MAQARQEGQAYFGALLQTVVGQAFAAAGYQRERSPLQAAGGRFRYAKDFYDGARGVIDFQVLIYSDSMWSSGAPSRFRVQLTRASEHEGAVARSLSRLVVDDFGVKILPAADYWWSYSDTDSLGKALAEAGHLIVGYGMPWLAGELAPPAD